MSTLSRLRRQMPFLTPSWAGDDEAEVQRLKWLRRPVVEPEVAPPILTRNPPAPVLSDEFLRPPMLTREPPAVDPSILTRSVVPEMEVPQLTRERRTQPRDLLADEQSYRRGMEAGGETITPLVRKPGKLATTLGFIGSLLQGGLPRAVGYGIQRFNPETWRNAEIDASRQREGELILQRKADNELANDESQRLYRGAQTKALDMRPELEANKLSQRQAEQERRTLAQIYNDLPEFDPASPANASLVEAMQSAGLPVVPKSRTKQVRFIQDAATGRWTVVNVDRATGTPDTVPVLTREGAPLATTSPTQVTNTTRERIATLNRKSREGIAAQNRQSREGIAAQKGARVSEQQVRDAAAAKGLDPEQAVQRARSRGMIK